MGVTGWMDRYRMDAPRIMKVCVVWRAAAHVVPTGAHREVLLARVAQTSPRSALVRRAQQ